MARNYTHLTLKLLFAQASACAYPGCTAPLVFVDRNAKTVVAQIAHIRSERPNGPRHDPDFTGDIDGPENLLLLCGTHHPPVDRHESLYSISELEAWKAAQVATAGPGTTLTPEDAQRFVRLTDREMAVLDNIAKANQRVISAAKAAAQEGQGVQIALENERALLQTKVGPVYQVDDEGNPSEPLRIELPLVDQRRFYAEMQRRWEAARPAFDAAMGSLREEVAILMMIGKAGIVAKAERVVSEADELFWKISDPNELEVLADLATDAVQDLWLTANGEVTE